MKVTYYFTLLRKYNVIKWGRESLLHRIEPSLVKKYSMSFKLIELETNIKQSNIIVYLCHSLY